MAQSTCIKCGGTVFETVISEPMGSKFKLVFIQCSACGGVVGVTEFLNVGTLIKKLAAKFKITIE